MSEELEKVVEEDAIEVELSDDSEIEVEIADDTPEEDKGRPRRAPDAEADIPAESKDGMARDAST